MIKISVDATAAEPVSVAEMLEHGRIDTSADDAYIAALISVARANAENKTHRLLRPGIIALTHDRFGPIELTPSPLRESSSLVVQYVDSTGSVQLLGTSVYEIHDDSDASPAILTTAYGQSWPTIQSVKGAVNVYYLAGYTTDNPIPEPIKQWIKISVINMYEQRTIISDVAGGASLGYQMKSGYEFLDGLLEPYVVHVVE